MTGINAMTESRPVKHSLTLRGHRTSVSLEDAFWRAFRMIAAQQNKTITALANEIDAARQVDCGLATAIRLYILKWHQDRLPPPPQQP